MEYRQLGRSGLRVSELSFGSWVTFGNQVAKDTAYECLSASYEAGINFFDNAEVYADGKSEEVMGAAFREMGWPRWSYVVSTKFFWGIHGGVNMTDTLNRKYLMQAIDASLERLQLDFVDLIFCHRPDPGTPIEETVWAMSDIIAAGKAHYWGTSEWSAADIRAAWEIADKHSLRKPVMEQPEYHLLHRNRVEVEYARLYEDIGLGLTTWSPLASGLLTGKYVDGVPAGSRATADTLDFVIESLIDKENNELVRGLIPVAEGLGCSMAQLAIAWCLRNPHVSTVITGASKLSQLQENLGALDVVPLLTADVLEQVETALAPQSRTIRD